MNHDTQNVTEIDYQLFTEAVEQTFKTDREKKYWKDSYEWVKRGSADTWDFPLLYMIWIEKGLIVFPNKNLISNIGFGEKAIHYKDKHSLSANAETYSILPLTHPKNVKRHYHADTNFLDNYMVDDTYRKISLFVQLKRKIRKHIPETFYNFIRDIIK